MGFTKERDATIQESDSESDSSSSLSSIEHKDTSLTLDNELRHQSKINHKSAVLTYLIGVDFKKHVDVLNLINMPNFDLSEEEEDANCSISQLLKVIKVILYQLGILEEKQKWRYDDFLREYKGN